MIVEFNQTWAFTFVKSVAKNSFNYLETTVFREKNDLKPTLFAKP